MIPPRSLRTVPPCLLLGFVLWGCTRDPAVDLPFAASAPPASLALTLKLPGDALRSDPSRHPQLVGFGPGGFVIRVLIRDEDDPQALDEEFPIDDAPDLVQEVVIGGIAPGSDVPVLAQVLGPAGNVLEEVRFLFDFFPGRLSSNDPSLGGVGSGMIVAESGGSSGPVDLFVENFDDLAINGFDTPCTVAGSRTPFIMSSGGVGGSAFLDPGGDITPSVGEILGNVSDQTFFDFGRQTQTVCFEMAVDAVSAGEAFIGVVNDSICPSVLTGTDIADDNLVGILVTRSGGQLSVQALVDTASVGSTMTGGTFPVVRFCIAPDRSVEYFLDGSSFATEMAGTVMAVVGHLTIRGRGMPTQKVDDVRVFRP